MSAMSLSVHVHSVPLLFPDKVNQRYSSPLFQRKHSALKGIVSLKIPLSLLQMTSCNKFAVSQTGGCNKNVDVERLRIPVQRHQQTAESDTANKKFYGKYNIMFS